MVYLSNVTDETHHDIIFKVTYIKRGGNGTAVGISADGMKNTLVQSLVQVVHRVVERQDHLDLAQLKMITLQN